MAGSQAVEHLAEETGIQGPSFSFATPSDRTLGPLFAPSSTSSVPKFISKENSFSNDRPLREFPFGRPASLASQSLKSAMTSAAPGSRLSSIERPFLGSSTTPHTYKHKSDPALKSGGLLALKREPKEAVGPKIRKPEPLQDIPNNLRLPFSSSSTRNRSSLAPGLSDDAHISSFSETALDAEPTPTTYRPFSPGVTFDSPPSNNQQPIRPTSFFTPGSDLSQLNTEAKNVRALRTPSNDGRARSASTIPPSAAQSGGSLSGLLQNAIVQLGAKDEELAAVTEQKHRLQRELENATNENSQLSARLAKVKTVAKEKIQESSTTLSAMKEELDALKTQSTQTVTMIEDVKVASMEVAQLKREVEETLITVSPLLDAESRLLSGPRSTAKQILDELCQDREALERDCLDTQRVVDILRDQLDRTSCELAESRERILGLETRQTQDGVALREAAEAVTASRNVYTELKSLAERLKQREQEMLAAYLKTAELENQNDHLRADIQTLQTHCEQQDSQLRAKISEAEQNVASKLQTEEELRDSLANHRATLQLHEERMQDLKHEISAQRTKEQSQRDSKLRILSEKEAMERRLAAEIQKSECHIGAMNEELQHLRVSLQDLAERHRLDLAAKQEAQQKVDELKDFYKKLEVSATSERLEDAKRTSGLQGELRKMEALMASSQMKAEELLKTEQVLVSTQSTRITTLEAELSAAGKALKEAEARCGQRDSELILETSGRQDLEQRLAASQTQIHRLTEEAAAHQTRANVAETRLAQAERKAQDVLVMAKKDARGVNEELQLEATRLSEENQRLKDQAETIVERHRTNELTTQESALVKLIGQRWQDATELDRAQKGNEIQRLQNAKMDLEKRVGTLEDKLSQALAQIEVSQNRTSKDSMPDSSQLSTVDDPSLDDVEVTLPEPVSHSFLLRLPPAISNATIMQPAAHRPSLLSLIQLSETATAKPDVDVSSDLSEAEESQVVPRSGDKRARPKGPEEPTEPTRATRRARTNHRSHTQTEGIPAPVKTPAAKTKARKRR